MRLTLTLMGFKYLTNESLIIVSCTSDALRDLILFMQFKKREKHPWRKVIQLY